MTKDEYLRNPPNEPDATEQLLAAWLVVYTEKAEAGEDGYVKMFRAWKKKSPDKFMQHVKGLELDLELIKAKKYAVANKEASAVQDGPDIGTEKCVAILEALHNKTLEEIKSKRP